MRCPPRDSWWCLGHLDGVNRESHIPIALLRAAGKDLQIFCLDFIAEIAQRVKKLLLHALYGGNAIGDGADQLGSADRLIQKRLEIDLFAMQHARAVIEIL